jgi:hypothetical protein
MRGELSREAIMDLGDPDFEFNWHDERTMPDLPQRLRGPLELLRFWEDLRSGWDDLILVALELIEAPDNRVLTLTRQTGRGRESGVPVEVHAFTSGRSGTERRGRSSSSVIEPKPSKPPGCRSSAHRDSRNERRVTSGRFSSKEKRRQNRNLLQRRRSRTRYFRLETRCAKSSANS